MWRDPNPCILCPADFYKEVLFDPYWQRLLAPLFREFNGNFLPHSHYLTASLVNQSESRHLGFTIYLREIFDGGFSYKTIRISSSLNEPHSQIVEKALVVLRRHAKEQQ